MYIFIMGLCTVTSLLLLLEEKKTKKENVLALWIVLLPAGRNLESLNHLSQKKTQQSMKDTDT